MDVKKQTDSMMNRLNIYSSVNELLLDEKYCDVTIFIGDQTFKCSRLLLAGISTYFDAMFFGSNFSEKDLSKNVTIEIHDVINAIAFEQILRFIQSGDINVTRENVYFLLAASDFLDMRMPYIDEQCTRYLQNCVLKTERIISNAVEILALANVTKKITLIDLMSKHIYEHFNEFASDDNFLDISFREFHSILQHSHSCGHINDTILLKSISRWINHSRKERKEYRHSLMEFVDISKVSGLYLAHMINLFEDFVDESVINDTADHIDGIDKFFTNGPSNSPLLHLFAVHKTSANTAVFSVKDGETVSWSCEIPSRVQIAQSIVVRDTLYCLSYRHLSNIWPTSTQTFSASKSIYTIPDSVLKNPPLVLSRFNICGFENFIYAYDANRVNSSKGNSYNEFSDEERSRGIYVYTCELDKWLPVPPLRDRVFNACMTMENNVLYLIGGRLEEDRLYRFMQTYDYRMKTWNKVPIPKTKIQFIISSCCTHQEKIYVSNTDRQRRSTNLDIYDPLAGVWSSAWRSNVFLRDIINPIKLASYKNELWMISTGKNMNISVYDTAPEAERTRNFSLRSLVDKPYSHFVDNVVF